MEGENVAKGGKPRERLKSTIVGKEMNDRTMVRWEGNAPRGKKT